MFATVFTATAIMWPHFSPVLVRFGPFAIHYYALAYITALLIGWRLVRYTASLPPVAATGVQVDDFLSWATLGIIFGGRIGYVCFYQPGYFFTHPAQIIAVWDGGMSFHGGFLGVTIAIIWFCLKNHIDMLRLAASPISSMASFGAGRRRRGFPGL
jgi:phosphatidylglycerol:prolipoprotein diacylglycerol transferase